MNTSTMNTSTMNTSTMNTSKIIVDGYDALQSYDNRDSQNCGNDTMKLENIMTMQ